MTVRINKQKINLREKLTEFEDKVNFEEVIRGLGEYTGNVGIGTTNPDAQLEIANITGSPQLLINNSGTSFETASIKFLSGGTGNPVSLIESGGTNSGKHGLFFSTGLETASVSPRMIIDSAGNVGIGTASPIGKLQVETASDSIYADSDQGTNFALILKNTSDLDGGSAGNNVGIAFYNYSTGNNFTRVSYISSVQEQDSARYSNLVFGTDDGTGDRDEKMRITAIGRVGIGTTNPAQKLDVNGNIAVQGTTVHTSDDRVKHNEQAIVGAIETLGKLTPKKYIKTTEMYEANHDFELDTDGNPVDADGEPVKHSIEAGVIAQQVIEVPELAFIVSPEGVDEDGNVTSPHGLNYNSLFTYAIAAIQEQQSIIEDLKSRIETLESK